MKKRNNKTTKYQKDNCKPEYEMNTNMEQDNDL